MKGYTPEGDLSYQQPYMNGLPDGAGQWFNPPTGKLMEEHIFSAGQLEAVKVFSEAGTMEEEFSFSSGINKKFTKFGQLESETPMDPQTFDILRDVVIGQFPK